MKIGEMPSVPAAGAGRRPAKLTGGGQAKRESGEQAVDNTDSDSRY